MLRNVYLQLQQYRFAEIISQIFHSVLISSMKHPTVSQIVQQVTCPEWIQKGGLLLTILGSSWRVRFCVYPDTVLSNSLVYCRISIFFQELKVTKCLTKVYKWHCNFLGPCSLLTCNHHVPFYCSLTTLISKAGQIDYYRYVLCKSLYALK